MFSIKQENIRKYYVFRPFFMLLLLITLFIIPQSIYSQQVAVDSIQRNDSLHAVNDSIPAANDSVLVNADSLNKAGKKPLLEAEVKYASEDSLIFSISGQKVFLFDKGVVNYQDIGLTGDYIQFDYSSKEALAAGTLDSAGVLAGKPVFTQGNEKLDADTLRYNFESKKGKIKNIVTQQGEGYLHSTQTKRLPDGEIHIKNGKYTTCDAPHPHFYIALTKAISIPNKRTVAGPAYLVFEDIPMPLGLPFGFFPNTNKRTSGFIIPEFRDEQRRGFGLESGGWYFALNDYLDISIAGSIYSRGTWGIETVSQYLKKYKYSGQFSARFFYNNINDDPGFQTSRDFKVNWTHSQDRKANPTRTFRASVDFSTSSFEKQQGTSFANILENQKNSSISYSKRWPGGPFNLSANLNGTQNTRDKSVSVILPSVNFNMDRVYPFRGKDDDGDYNWLENIQVSYNAKLINQIKRIGDSLIFTKTALKRMENGFSHTIPISLENIRVFKMINIAPSVSYSGALFPYYIEKRPLSDTNMYLQSKFEIDTIHRVTYAHSFAGSISVSAAPKLYGMYESTKPNSKIIAVRHVLTPRVAASFAPDMKGLVPDYYRKVPTSSSAVNRRDYQEYSIYEGQVNPTPSVSGKSGSLQLGLGNNVEMKVRSKDDTTGKGKKVVLLDNFDFTTSYQPFSRTYKWSPVNMSARSTLFNRNLQLTMNASFDPYSYDSTGDRINVFLIKDRGRLLRLTSLQFTAGFRLQSGGNKKEAQQQSTNSDIEQRYEGQEDMMDIYDETGGAVGNNYVNFEIPWSLNIDFSYRLDKQKMIQNGLSRLGSRKTSSVRLSGDISLTPKWKIGINTSYDFIAKEFSATNISVYRDLHCWEMRFGVVPFGNYKSYSFTISAKSAILRDLKWDKRKTWHDNF